MDDSHKKQLYTLVELLKDTLSNFGYEGIVSLGIYHKGEEEENNETTYAFNQWTDGLTYKEAGKLAFDMNGGIYSDMYNDNQEDEDDGDKPWKAVK